MRARSRHSVVMTWRKDVSHIVFASNVYPFCVRPQTWASVPVGGWKFVTIYLHIYDIVGREGESSKITRVIGNLSGVHRVHYYFYYYFITKNNSAQFYCVLDLDFAGVCAWLISPAQFPIRVIELGRGNSHSV